MTQPTGQDQERDGGEAPAQDETAATWTSPVHTTSANEDDAWRVLRGLGSAQHEGTVIHMVGDRYAWTCRCGSGRDVSAATDWDTAAAELREHERISYPLYATIPEAEYALILAVVAAARQWRAQVDSPSRVLRADSHHALVAAVDALPPQAPPADPLREATEAVERSRQREAGLDMDRIERVRTHADAPEVTDVT